MSRPPKQHILKCWPEPFQAMLSGAKRHEFRKDDRGFSVGDMLTLMEWDPKTNTHTGQVIERKITYIGRGFGIPEGYVCMSVEQPEASAPSGGTLTDGALAILTERRRQIEMEGWSLQSDRLEHPTGELVEAAICYADLAAKMTSGPIKKAEIEKVPNKWPWTKEHWKPKSARQNLIRAGALIAAELDRLDSFPTELG